MALPLGSAGGERSLVKPVPLAPNEREETDKLIRQSLQNPFFWETTVKREQNSHTPSQTRRRRHRAFREEDPSLTAAASPALADKMTFQMNPMAHV